jgi:uncharacterized delta-60 repeat protein
MLNSTLKNHSDKRQSTLNFFIHGSLGRWMILLLCLCFAIITAQAAPGDLDPTFGTNGLQTYPTNLDSNVYDLFVQPNGKILTIEDQVISRNHNYFITRFNSDGTRDLSFGTGGKVALVMPVGGWVSDITFQPDGKLIVVGSFIAPSPYALVARFNQDGSRDTSFGVDGVTQFTFDLTDPVMKRSLGITVILQPDGKILVGGGYDSTSNPVILFAIGVARLDSNGVLDNSFGNNGVTFFAIQGQYYNFAAMTLQSDGKIVIVGRLNIDGSAVTRYNANGILDTGFANGGTFRINFGSFHNNASDSVAIQPDGMILVAGGNAVVGSFNSFFYRLDNSGVLDSSFGTAGVSRLSNFNLGEDIKIMPNQKILVVGYTRPSSSGVSNFAIGRLNQDGSLDTSFGDQGKVTTPFRNFDYWQKLTILPNQKYLVVGKSETSNGYNLVFARFKGDSIENSPHTSFDFDGDGKADPSVFRSSDTTWYLNRPTSGFAAVQFGLANDKLVPADYDGDGKTDVAVYRNGVWYWLNSSNNQFNAFQFGLANDIPVPADYDGDGKADQAVYRGGTWYLNRSTNGFAVFQFGLPADKPVPADYDGDGKVDAAVYRDGIWYRLNSSNGQFLATAFGLSTDKTVPADYDGDHKTDLAVYRNGVWYINGSTRGFTVGTFGLATDKPVPADYDGDGLADIAVYRNGVWYLQQSNAGFAQTSFGLANDNPIPSVFIP